MNLVNLLKQNGGNLIDECEVEKISSQNKKKFVTVKYKNGRIKTFSSDFIFLSAGAIIVLPLSL